MPFRFSTRTGLRPGGCTSSVISTNDVAYLPGLLAARPSALVEGAGIEPALRCRTVSDLLHNAMPYFAAASPLGQPPMLCVCMVLKVSELHSGLIWVDMMMMKAIFFLN
jgi:hypothetical protein